MLNASSPTMTAVPRPIVGSVAQAAALLRYLSALDGREGVNAIARATGLSPSSCFNLLKQLVADDLVDFDPATKGYALGQGVVDLARASLSRDRLIATVRPAMEAFARSWEATVGLWRVGGRDRLVMVACAESSSPARIHMAVGQRQPQAAGALGRALLAAREVGDDELGHRFAALRWGQAPSFVEWRAQIADAASRGFALDADNFLRGVTTLAVAVPGTPIRYCVSATMFSGQHAAARLGEMGEQLVALAHDAARAPHV